MELLPQASTLEAKDPQDTGRYDVLEWTIVMPTTLECVLMRKCKVKKGEARKLVALGQKSGGKSDSVEWSVDLEKECIRIHKERQHQKKEYNRFEGLSPFLAWKVQQHEKEFNTTVEIKPLHIRSCASSMSRPRLRTSPERRSPRRIATGQTKKIQRGELAMVVSPPHLHASETNHLPSRPRNSESSIASESSTSELSSLSVNSATPVERQHQWRVRSVSPPFSHKSRPTCLHCLESPENVTNSPGAEEDTVSYLLPPSGIHGQLQSPTKRLAKLAADMSIVSPLVRSKKMSFAASEFTTLEMTLRSPVHRRRRRRGSRRPTRRGTLLSIQDSDSTNSRGESSISSQGSDSIHSYRSFNLTDSGDEGIESRAQNCATALLGRFMMKLIGSKEVMLIADNALGSGPPEDETENDPPKLLGISDSEYESDAMYESDTLSLEDYDFFGDDGSLDSSGATAECNSVDRNSALLPMPTLEAPENHEYVIDKPPPSHRQTELNDGSEDASVSRHSRNHTRPDRPGPYPMRAHQMPLQRATSLDGFGDLHLSRQGRLQNRRGKNFAVNPPQRASSFDGHGELGLSTSSDKRKGRKSVADKAKQKAPSHEYEDLNLSSHSQTEHIKKGRKRDAV